MNLLVNKLVLLLLIIVTTSSHANSFSAQQAGQGFTAITHNFTSSTSNPALLSTYNDDDNLFFSLNVGGLGSDEYNLMDTADRIVDNLDRLEKNINNIINVPPADLPNYLIELDDQVVVIIDDLEYADGKSVSLRSGLNLQLIIPNKYVSFGFFSNQYGKIGGGVNYDQGDEKILYEAIFSPDGLDQSDLQSSATGVGYSIEESGVMLSYQAIKHASYDLNLGSKIKYQHIDLFYHDAKIADFDDEDFDFREQQYITDESSINIDLGLYTTWGKHRQWSLALVSNNLFAQEVTHTAKNMTFNLDMTTILGMSYQNSWLTLATEVDLTEREHFQQQIAAKYVSVGAEFRIFEHMKFRLGVRSDLNNNDVDIYTLGLGISPWDMFLLDIAAFTGDRDNAGAAIELGIKI